MYTGEKKKEEKKKRKTKRKQKEEIKKKIGEKENEAYMRSQSAGRVPRTNLLFAGTISLLPGMTYRADGPTEGRHIHEDQTEGRKTKRG